MKFHIIFLMLSLMAFSTNAFSSYVIYIKNNTGICQKEHSGEIIKQDENPGKLIHYCLDQLKERNGGKLTIAAGSYKIDQSLLIGENIQINGDGNATKLIFSGSKKGEGGLIIKDADGIKIFNISVLNEEGNVDAGIIVDNSGSCNIKDVKVIGFEKYGIWLRNNTFLSTIDGCTVAGNLVSNIFLDSLAKDGRFGDFIPNTVTNSMIFGGGKGIETRRAIVANIIGCSIYQTKDIGIHLHSTSNSVLVSGCRTFQISNHAVLIEDTHELNVSGNIFCWHTGHGIIVRNASWGTISGNEFIDNGSYNPGVKNNSLTFQEVNMDDYELKNGILLQNVIGYHVGGNAIFNWPVCPKMKYGIEEDEYSINNTISGNNINYYELEPVKSNGKGTVVENNRGLGEIPYVSLQRREDRTLIDFTPKIIQSFETELTEKYIKLLSE
ncbi:MAG: right-handed parallel beta-helix repeat-containing protein [bacterium]